ISAPSTNRRRWRSSVNLPSPPRELAAEMERDKVLLRHAAAGGLDRGLGTRGRKHALEHELLADFALLDHLRLLGGGRHQLGGAQGGEVDLAGLQALQLVQQHLGGVVLGARAEADLGQTALHRHLAALEAGLDLALAGAGVRTLVAAAGGLAEAGADAATDAHAFLAGTLGGLERIELHLLYPPGAQDSTRTR